MVSCLNQGSCPPGKPYFRIKSLSSYSLKFTNSGSNPWIEIDSTDTIKWDNYFVRIGLNAEYYANKINVNFSNDRNALFALSCDEPGYKGSKIGVKNIQVITLNDYNEKFKKNDTVNEMILLNYWTRYSEHFYTFFPINDFIEQNSLGVLEKTIEFKTIEEPGEEVTLSQFIFILELINGEIFVTKTKEIKLSK